jgi:hypothetical protein
MLSRSPIIYFFIYWSVPLPSVVCFPDIQEKQNKQTNNKSNGFCYILFDCLSFIICCR